MPLFSSSPRRRRSLVLLLCGAAGCGSFDLRHDPPDDGPEQVTLQITAVPADVACVRVSAAGPGRTVVRELGVMPGASVDESFAGLPLGTVVFRAEAFGTGCEPVTKTTVPSWVSEPASVTVALGRLASVALTMHRNGRAKVGVDFVDEAGTDGGQRGH